MLNSLRIIRTATAALALLTCVNSRAAQTVFYEPSNCTEEGWTCQNASNGKWAIGTDNRINGTTTSGTNNSWLFSPQFKLKAGVKYTFSYSVRAYSSTYPVVICDFYLVSEPTKTSYRSAVCDFGNITTANSTAVITEKDFTPETDATVYFAAHDKTVYGSGKGYILQFRNFKIMADDGKTIPLAVTGLTATPDSDGANNVTLSWTNPTLMSDGTDATITSISIARGTDVIATLTDSEHITPGATASFTDNVPAPGKYDYSVEVTAANGEKSEKATINSGYVGSFPAIIPDYTFNLSDETTNEQWTLTTNGESNEWTFNPTSGALEVSVSNLKAIDALATTPAIALDATKAYLVTYKQVATNPANIINMEFLTGPSKEGMTSVLDPSAQVDQKTEVEKSFKFTPAETGNSYFAWHATAGRMTSSYYKNTVSIKEISITEIPVLPRVATNVKATAATDGSLSATVTWTNPTLSETGLPLTALTADIFRDGTMIAEGVEANGSYTDTTVPCAGYHTYQVVIRNEAGATAETPASAKTDYVGMPFTIPFASDFANNPFAWATETLGEADTAIAWTFSATAATMKANDKTMNHALLTPPLALAGNEVYELTVNAKNNRYSDYDVAVYLLSAGAKPTEQNMIAKSTLGYTAKDVSLKFAVSENGNYTIAYLIEPKTSSYGSGSEVTFTINSISVVTAPKVPAIPQDITALSTNENKVEITWTMPAETPEGASLTDDVTVKIYRGATIAEDVEPLFEVADRPGLTLSRTDEAPAEGLNTYSLLFIYGDQQTEPVVVESDFVGDAVNIVYTADFTSEEGRSKWTIVDNSSSSYKGTTFEYTEDNTLKVLEGTSMSSASSRLDDWIISPVFTVFSGSNIIIEFEAKGYATSPTGYSNTAYAIYLGKDKTIDALKATKIASGKLNSADFTTYRHEYTPESTRAEGKEKKVVGIQFGGSYGYPYAEVRAIKIDSDRWTLTGVENVAPDAATAPIWFDGNKVYCADSNASLSIFNASGRAVTSGRGSVDLASLPAGIYIVAANIYGKTATLKIAK